MNNERRFDRMERVLRLLINAGKRGRTRLNDLDEKFGMLIDAQIKTEDSLREMNRQSIAMREESQSMREDSKAMRDDLDTRSRQVYELFRLTDEKIAVLAEAQIVSERKLSALIERLDSN